MRGRASHVKVSIVTHKAHRDKQNAAQFFRNKSLVILQRMNPNTVHKILPGKIFW